MTCGLFAVDLFVLGLDPLRQLVGHLVVGVVLQHIEDKALFDRLAHGVDVEGLGLVLFRWGQGRIGQAAEQLQGFRLGGRGKGEVAEVAAVAPGGDGGVEDIFRGEFHIVGGVLGQQHLFQLPGGGAGLRRVRLVGDDRIAALLEADAVLDRLEHKGEGLDGDDDDRLRVLQRLRQLLRLGAVADVAVDPPDHAIDVFELVDGVLQLIIEHGAVGDDDDRMELLVPLAHRRAMRADARSRRWSSICPIRRCAGSDIYAPPPRCVRHSRDG